MAPGNGCLVRERKTLINRDCFWRRINAFQLFLAAPEAADREDVCWASFLSS